MNIDQITSRLDSLAMSSSLLRTECAASAQDAAYVVREIAQALQVPGSASTEVLVHSIRLHFAKLRGEVH